MITGRLVDASSGHCCHAVETLVMSDRRLKVQEIAIETGIFYGSVINILLQHLDLSKVCVRWVPRFLMLIQKSFHVEKNFRTAVSL